MDFDLFGDDVPWQDCTSDIFWGLSADRTPSPAI